MDRRDAIAKATVTTTVASGGLLTPKQSNAFIEVAKEASSFGRAIRTETVPTISGTINRLATSARLIRAAVENADDGYRAEPTFPTVGYTTTKIRLPFEVTEDTYQSNIEGEALEEKLVRNFATQMGLDLDDLDNNGDTAAGAGPDQAFLQIHDGLLKLAANVAGVHRVNGGAIAGGTLGSAHFFAALRALPNKYRQQASKIGGTDATSPGGLVWLMSPNRHVTWVETLVARATAGGDAALSNGSGIGERPLGIPVLEVPFFPDSRIMLTNPRNLVRVIFNQIRRRKVTGDTDWELATRDKRGYIFFIREGFLIEEPDALVDLYGLV